MNEFVGVMSGVDILLSGSLKREALMFKKIAIPLLDSLLAPNEKHLSQETVRLIGDLEWLLNQGIIFQPEQEPDDTRLLTNEQYITAIEEEAKLDEELANLFNDGVSRTEASFRERFLRADYLRLRFTAIQLRELSKADSYPIFPLFSHLERDSEVNKLGVVRVVLNALPIPNDLTSWEQILEYRSDPDSHAKFLDLRNWMNEVARAALTPIEVEQKLEHLLSQYQRHMALHKMKTNTGTLETIVVAGAEFVEHLAKFKWGKIAKGLFSLKHRRIAMMEGELTSPGNEVAYVVNARKAFPSPE
jgi:hypothetical protein